MGTTYYYNVGAGGAATASGGTSSFGTGSATSSATGGGGGVLLKPDGLEVAQSGGVVAFFNRMTSTGNIIELNYNGAAKGSISTDGNNVAFNTSSDRRVKENIIDTHLGLDDLMRLNVRDFAFINDQSHATSTGFIAQELNQVFADAVSKNGDDGEVPLGATSSPWGVDYGRITPLIVKAVQDIASLGTTFKANLIAWLADAGNGIQDFFARRVRTQELCVDDICVTRDQFAEVFGNQAAAGAQSIESGGAPAGSSAVEEDAADDAATTTSASDSSSTPQIPSTSNDNEPAVTEDAQNASEPEEAPDDTLLVDTPATPEPAPEAPAPEVDLAVDAPPDPANDNPPPAELPATGSE